ncbi:MAG: hypothetical protein AAF570_03565 [Bacteroidota bacterium]
MIELWSNEQAQVQYHFEDAHHTIVVMAEDLTDADQFLLLNLNIAEHTAPTAGGLCVIDNLGGTDTLPPPPAGGIPGGGLGGGLGGGFGGGNFPGTVGVEKYPLDSIFNTPALIHFPIPGTFQNEQKTYIPTAMTNPL